MKRISPLLVLAFVMLFGSYAHAGAHTATVSSFKIDDSRKGSGGPAGDDRLIIFFTSSPNICPVTHGNGTNSIVLSRSYDPTNFDNWVKTVTSAFLAGKALIIDTYAPNGNTASNCQIRAIGISN